MIVDFDRLDRIKDSGQKDEDNFRVLSKAASDAIITINDESKILFVNAAAENYFGCGIRPDGT